MNKVKKNKPEQKSKGGFARGVNTLLSGRFLTREYVQSNLPFIFFIVALMVAYIAYGYFSESNMKELVSANAELHELKTRNLTIQAHLGKIRAQSSVEQSIKDLGLVESTTPPIIISVPKSEILNTESDE